MTIFTRGNRSIAGTVALLGLLVVMAGCGKVADNVGPYHCPMHPTYVSDQPGDCPICGMRLVPIDKGGLVDQAHPVDGHPHGAMPATTAPATASPAATAGATVWTCPMDPEVVSDKPGKCPKCGMDLEPKDAKSVDHLPEVSPPATPAAPATPGPRKLLFYRNPMDPKVTSPVPMKDSMGMDYVPVYSDEISAAGVVTGLAAVQTTAEGRRLAGIQTVAAKQERLATTIRTVGSVTVDETRIRHVHTKVSGWVDKLFVDFTGQTVKKGRPILSIYSQELLAGQEEYLSARKAAARFAASSLPEVRKGGEELVTAARRRLELLDVPPGLIATIERTGKPQRVVTLMAPSSGVVTTKDVFEGHEVDPGMELFAVTDLSHVWIEADVYENEAGLVHVGDPAVLTLAYDPGRQLTGKVAFIYPYMDPATRTLKIRFDFPNPDIALKPAMYVNVELQVAVADGIVVPDSAVMDTGSRKVAFVDAGGGRFEPRVVRTGLRADGRVQVMDGLRAGEKVAVAANFLLNSESRLRAALQPASQAEK